MAKYADLVAANGKQQQKKEKTPEEDIKISNEIPRYQDISQPKPADDFAEKVRKVVKEVGRETSPLRITPFENGMLEDIVYTFKKSGIRTDKTQIIRIALNHALNDYEENGEQSVLSTTLQRLNA